MKARARAVVPDDLTALGRHRAFVAGCAVCRHPAAFSGALSPLCLFPARSTMPHPAANSLRRTLLRRLAAPLSLLALMSGLIAYWLAWQYTQHVVDRSLADLATAISKQIQIAGPDASRSRVPPLAQAMFSDPVEQLVYRISNGETEIAGDPNLPLQGTSVRRHALRVRVRNATRRRDRARRAGARRSAQRQSDRRRSGSAGAAPLSRSPPSFWSRS